MQGMKTRFFAFALALGLGACGGMRWNKPGADEAERAKDLATCRGQAQAKAGIADSFAAATPIDPRFGSSPFGLNQGELRMQEAQALGMCMRGKGYGLGPEGK